MENSIEEETNFKTTTKQRACVDAYNALHKEELNKKNLERYYAKKEDPEKYEKIKQQNRLARQKYREKQKQNKPTVVLVNKNSKMLSAIEDMGFKEGVDWKIRKP